MEECGLHAHFDAQAVTSSRATWGSAKPTMMHICGHNLAYSTGLRCPDPAKSKKGYAVDMLQMT